VSTKPDRAPVRGLYGIVDTSASPHLQHLELAEALLQAGVSVLQLRMKDADDAQRLPILRALKELADPAGAQVLVNDHVHLASAVPGVGVHLGQDDHDPRQARAILGDSVLIGLSTHTPRQAREAEGLGVDYIGYGPIFSARGKHISAQDQRPLRSPVGLAALKAVVREAAVPVVAIGGIDLDRLPLLLATGVEAVAVLSAVTSAPSPVDAARAFQAGFHANTRSA
jgi:thiamine-phosphate pyrophosphorylase